MNSRCNMLIDKLVAFQHLLNKQLAKREINNPTGRYPQLLFWCVEFLLRAHIAYYQRRHIPIHQFNKNSRLTDAKFDNRNKTD